MDEPRVAHEQPDRWPGLVPELLVSDLAASLRFWCDVLGFRVAYDRPEDRFAYVELGSAHVMLEERDAVARQWVAGMLQQPYGRGINFQIEAPHLDEIRMRLGSIGWPLYCDIEERWYRSGHTELGVRQFLVQDPDGYLVRLAQSIGKRPYRQ